MTVKVISEIAPLRSAVATARAEKKSVGLVPTMGALHRGHIALVELARKQTDFVVVSIFVNPTQFGPKEDLSRYPRTLERDLELCTEAGVDLVFHPTSEVIYPPGFKTFVEVTDLQDVLCGASRPGHFRGVATVVLKLFNLVQPDRAFFGQKDAQQVRVLKQMVRDLNVPIEMVVGDTVREPDGFGAQFAQSLFDTGTTWQSNRSLSGSDGSSRSHRQRRTRSRGDPPPDGGSDHENPRSESGLRRCRRCGDTGNACSASRADASRARGQIWGYAADR